MAVTPFDLNKANLRVNAAQTLHAGKMQEHTAALMVAAASVVERTRLECIAAFEAFLDTLADQARLQRLSMNLPPDELV